MSLGTVAIPTTQMKKLRHKLLKNHILDPKASNQHRPDAAKVYTTLLFNHT